CRNAELHGQLTFAGQLFPFGKEAEVNYFNQSAHYFFSSPFLAQPHKGGCTCTRSFVHTYICLARSACTCCQVTILLCQSSVCVRSTRMAIYQSCRLSRPYNLFPDVLIVLVSKKRGRPVR